MICTVLTMMMILSCSMPAYAIEENQQAATILIPSGSFDLSNLGAQEVVIDVNGVEATVGISEAICEEPNSGEIQPNSSYPLEVGTWSRKIYYNSVILNMEYYLNYTVAPGTLYTTINRYYNSRVSALGGTASIVYEGIVSSQTTSSGPATARLQIYFTGWGGMASAYIQLDSYFYPGNLFVQYIE